MEKVGLELPLFVCLFFVDSLIILMKRLNFIIREGSKEKIMGLVNHVNSDIWSIFYLRSGKSIIININLKLKAIN
jgi:hypothetical protein